MNKIEKRCVALRDFESVLLNLCGTRVQNVGTLRPSTRSKSRSEVKFACRQYPRRCKGMSDGFELGLVGSGSEGTCRLMPLVQLNVKGYALKCNKTFP